ncbi:MAG: hypothetical protein Q9165_007485 [Trypethelium subeluteriae]
MVRQGNKDRVKDSEQIQDLAFNTFGWAAEIPDGLFEGHATSVLRIKARNTSTISYKAELEKVTKEKTDILRQSLALSPEESGTIDSDPDEAVYSYIVVGFVHIDIPPDREKRNESQTKQKPVGLQRPNEEDITRYDAGAAKLPLVVVYKHDPNQTDETEVQSQQTSKVKLWALLNPQKELCTPHVVSCKEVFYLPMFRDETTVIQQRGPNWNRKIREVTGQATGAQLLSEKQNRYRRARDTTKITLDPLQSFGNEILALTSAFDHSREPWLLKALGTVLEQVNIDLKFRPLPNNTIMRKFVDSQNHLTMEEAQQMKMELVERWPGIQSISTESLMKLHYGIRICSKDLLLECSLLRPFLIDGAHRLQTAPAMAFDDDNSLAELIRDIYAMVKRLCKDVPEPVLSVPDNNYKLLLMVVRDKLTEAINSSRRFDAELENMCGDYSSSQTPAQLADEFSKATDVDSAKRCNLLRARWLVAEGLAKTSGFVDTMEGMI